MINNQDSNFGRCLCFYCGRCNAGGGHPQIGLVANDVAAIRDAFSDSGRTERADKVSCNATTCELAYIFDLHHNL